MMSAQPVQYEFPAPLRAFAKIVSYIFHPIFIPLYVFYFFVYVHPSFFAGFTDRARLMTLVIVAFNIVFFPLVTVLLLRGLKFIDSIYLRTRKDRIIPYMACGIFYFWAYTVFKKQGSYPPITSSFLLGIFFAVSAGLLANIYFKISMHALGMGGWLGIFYVISLGGSMLMTWPLAIVILCTGLVLTARMIISDHTNRELLWGLAIGFLSQIAAMYFIG